MRPENLKVGDRVQLHRGIVRHDPPDGRQNYKSATITMVGGGDGAVQLDRDLNGLRWWNASDLQRSRAPKRK